MCWPYWSITQTYQFTFILYIRVRSCSAEQLVTEGLQSVSSALGFKSAYNWLVCLLMLWLSHGQWNWTTEYNGTKLPMSQILKKAYLIFFPSTSFTVMFRRSALLLHTEKSRLLMRAGPVRPLFILAVCVFVCACTLLFLSLYVWCSSCVGHSSRGFREESPEKLSQLKRVNKEGRETK